MRSRCPARTRCDAEIPLAAASCLTETPLLRAIAVSVSPCFTVWLRTAGFAFAVFVALEAGSCLAGAAFVVAALAAVFFAAGSAAATVPLAAAAPGIRSV